MTIKVSQITVIKMTHSILINTPVSSPLHAQLNLPLLKGALENNGFPTTIIDSNIAFFHDFLGSDLPQLGANEFRKNPLLLLSYYNDIEALLWERSKNWPELEVGLRSLKMKHERLFCKTVFQATADKESNPFIDFYERLVREKIIGSGAKIIGIAVTFQDQIIPAYTLAAVLRKEMPDACIVFGGQMITRCYDSILAHKGISSLGDYLVLWDGEIPLLNLHKHLLRGERVDLTNVLACDKGPDQAVNRTGASLKGAEIPDADFRDFDLNAYLLPEYLLPFQTTRGCYANCAFCAIPYGSNSYRVRPGVRVVEDLVKIQKYVRETYGREATYFKFMEDTSAPSLLKEISEEIEARGLDIKWETFARLEKAFAGDGFLDQLYRGGCRKIHWGLETNDPDILKDMNKKTSVSFTDEVLSKAGEAGIMNFCFVLIGFPGETDEQRQSLAEYIIGNPYIHTITLTTFDLTRGAPMERNFKHDNIYGIDCVPAEDFQVRLPYYVNGENWKAKIVPAGHEMMTKIIQARPDIGFVTLFPDQVRAMLCDWFGNDWGRIFVERYGKENIRDMLINTERYAQAYKERRDIDPAALPEPLRREHYRTKEDMMLLAKAFIQRKNYENRRLEQV